MRPVRLGPFALLGLALVVAGIGLLPGTATRSTPPCTCPVGGTCGCATRVVLTFDPIVLGVLWGGVAILAGSGVAATLRWVRRLSRPG